MSAGKERVGRPVLFALSAMVSLSLAAGVLVAAATLPFVGAIGMAAKTATETFDSLPDELITPPLKEQSVILASDGSLLATIYEENRIEVPLREVAPILRQAIIATEDSRFYEHRGFDPVGTLRAFTTNLRGNAIRGGGSSLTQQYVKGVLLSNAETEEEAKSAGGRNYLHKFRELRYAIALEQRLTKDEILERYLNIAYFGAGAYGIEAASQRYFSKHASELKLREASVLAGLVQSPSALDPRHNPEGAQKRRDHVLDRMVATGDISEKQADKVRKRQVKKDLKISDLPNGCASSKVPYFCDYVVQTILDSEEFGPTEGRRRALLSQGGLTIRTTLDRKAQRSAQKAVNDFVPRKDKSKKAAAITMVEPGTGRILAMAQNRKWGTKGRGNTAVNYNVGLDKNGILGAQAGSTFKPVILAAAMEKGVSVWDQFESPWSKTYKDFTSCVTGETYPAYTVPNGNGNTGMLNMYRATATSANNYFMALQELTGLCRPAEIADALGAKRGNGKPFERVPSFALGSNEVTVISLAETYATFAAHGTHCDSVAIDAILDRDNRRLPVPQQSCQKATDRGIADTITAVLTGVIDGYWDTRTGANMSLGRPAAGKTGTTNDAAAVWFAGYTPELAAAVWVGDPRGGQKYPMKDVTINGTYYSSVSGAALAGPIWREAMLGTLEDTPMSTFELTTRGGAQLATNLQPAPPKPKPAPAPAPTQPADDDKKKDKTDDKKSDDSAKKDDSKSKSDKTDKSDKSDKSDKKPDDSGKKSDSGDSSKKKSKES